MLVVGAGGQVGGALMARLGSRGVGSWRRPVRGGLALDLEDPGGAAAVVERSGATVVCVAAGFTHVDGCEAEPERAATVNCDAPAALAAAARQTGGRTVYLSTEYVFDGTAGPYREDDEQRPLSVYGRTKAEGELAVLDADPAALVIRTTVVYGPEARGKNFAYQLAARLGTGERMRVPVDQVSSPTYNPDLAAAVVALVDAGRRGVVHVAGDEILDRATFARRLATAMGLDPGLVDAVATADLGQVAPRPLQAGLLVDELRRRLPDVVLHRTEDAVAHWARTQPADAVWRRGGGNGRKVRSRPR